MPENDDKMINPQVKETVIGIQDLRKIKIYPLSMADQFKLTEVISGAISVFFKETGGSSELTPEAIAALIGLFKVNINEVLTIVTGEKKVQNLLKEITNDQLANIFMIVWEDNYAGPVKKVKGLFEGTSLNDLNLNLSQGPSQQSVKSTDIDSKTSIEKPSKKVD